MEFPACAAGVARLGFSGRYTKVNRCLSEGRRRFHDRLAGIETGAECERLAPQLSALADGEATAADMTLLRPHVRTCLMCRARLRDYRAAPARVAAMTPPLAAGSLLTSARELFSGAAGWISERSASLTARWHQAAELAAAHKVAAVAASTAVLAGGGGVTVATPDRGHHDRPSAAVVGPATSRPEPSSAASDGAPSPAPGDNLDDKGPARARAQLRGEPAPSRPREANPPRSAEFTPGPIAPRAAPMPQPVGPRKGPGEGSSEGGEFSP